MSEDNINPKSPAASSDSRKRRRSIDKAPEDADLGAPMEKALHESSEDSKRAYAGMYVPKEVTESSSGKDSDNTPPGDDIDVIIENVKKASAEVIPQRRSLKGLVWLADITLEKPNLDSVIDAWVIQQSKALQDITNKIVVYFPRKSLKAPKSTYSYSET